MGEVSTKLEDSYSMASQIFFVIFEPILKILFVFKFEWLKFLKDPFEEDSPIVVPGICHS